MELKRKRVLVTGGAGFIGSNLVDRIIREKPAKIIVVDNFFLGSQENLASARAALPDLVIERMDASDLASMHGLVEAECIDVVFNLAVVPLPASLKYPAWTFSTNVGIAVTFCELARLGSIKTLVHCSSSEAYGSAERIPMDETHPLIATTPYAASKAAGDQVVLSYIRTFNIDAVIVRPFNNFGPRQNAGSYAGIIPIVVQGVKSGREIEIHGDGEQTRDYIYVGVTADAFVQAYEHEATRGKVINIATGHEISINQLVQRLLNALGQPNYPVVHTAPRIGDVRRHRGGVELAHRLFGFEPSAITDQQIQETVDWYLV